MVGWTDITFWKIQIAIAAKLLSFILIPMEGHRFEGRIAWEWSAQ